MTEGNRRVAGFRMRDRAWYARIKPYGVLLQTVRWRDPVTPGGMTEQESEVVIESLEELDRVISLLTMIRARLLEGRQEKWRHLGAALLLKE